VHDLECIARQLLAQGHYVAALETAMEAIAVEPIRETARKDKRRCFVITPPAGVFLVPARREGDHFRARITYSPDVTSEPGRETEVLTAHADGVHQHLTTWLQQITSDS
jgi:hypothetical protein